MYDVLVCFWFQYCDIAFYRRYQLLLPPVKDSEIQVQLPGLDYGTTLIIQSVREFPDDGVVSVMCVDFDDPEQEKLEAWDDNKYDAFLKAFEEDEKWVRAGTIWEGDVPKHSDYRMDCGPDLRKIFDSQKKE